MVSKLFLEEGDRILEAFCCCLFSQSRLDLHLIGQVHQVERKAVKILQCEVRKDKE